MKRTATEDATPQRSKRVVKSLAEKARLQRLRQAACDRAASAPGRLAVVEARAARHASTQARQVQAKQVKAAKQAAKFDRKGATAAAAAAKQAARFDRKFATAAAVDRQLTRAARQSGAVNTKAAKARQQKRRSKHPLLNTARQGVHFQAHHVSGLDINKGHRHQLDRMKEECPYCKALMWLGEKVSARVNSCVRKC